jgi:hypothetical protein
MSGLTLTSRTDKALTLSLTAGGGETTFEIEANREPDFSADESIMKTGAAAGSVTIDGLPSDTIWYLRARATNTTPKGAWSTVLLASTSPPAAPGAYGGYSIEPAILVVPEPLDQLACAAADAGAPATNLANDDPLSTMRVQGSSSFNIVFHTPGRAIDVIALLGTLANEDATWRIRGATSQANLTASPTVDTGAVALRVNSGIGRRSSYHAYRRLSTSYTLEWWRIDITHTAPTFIARNLVVGLARQSVNYSRGAGKGPNDYGSMSRTVLGSPDRVVGWRGKSIDFQLSWLNEAEFEAKWSDLDTLVGLTYPVLAIPNPKANLYLNDRIAFGEITNMRGENMRSAKWQRTLEIRSLY